MNRNPKINVEFPRKLTVEQVSWIKAVIALDRRERRARGLKKHSHGLFIRLAAMHKVSVDTIQAIARRKRWRAVKAKDWSSRSLG